MYDIAICDDDAVFAADFQRQLAGALDKRGVQAGLTVFSQPEALLAAVESGKEYALLFLDVVFSRTEQGIRLAGTLRQKQCPAAVVFMSTYADFAVASYDVEALYYLTKPVDDEKLGAALDRFLRRDQPVRLRFASAQGVFYVATTDVLYFEIYSHQIVVHKTDGTSDSCVGTLKELESHLPAGTFVRPHRSYLVNLDHIYKIVRYRLRLTSGDEIPVSRNLYQQVQRAFVDRAGRRAVAF